MMMSSSKYGAGQPPVHIVYSTFYERYLCIVHPPLNAFADHLAELVSVVDISRSVSLYIRHIRDSMPEDGSRAVTRIVESRGVCRR